MRALREHVILGQNESFYVGFFPHKAQCDANYWHFHPEYEIVFINNGTGTRVVGSHSSTYENGELIFLGPNLPHLPFGNDQNPDNYEIVIQFGQQVVDQVLGLSEARCLKGLFNRSRSGLVFGGQTKAKAATYIQDFRAGGITRLTLLLQLLNDLDLAPDVMSLDATPLNIQKPNSDLKRLETIYELVSEGYQTELSLAELAQSVGLTKNSLCRFFKKVTGKTLSGFIHQYRISVAKEYLRDGKANINEIAFRCGFNELSFFNRKFREIAGMTPSEYRRKFQRLQLTDFPH